MFGKMMNSFYYGKSGKGDYRKEDLPQNRWQLFWEMLRIRLSALCRLNLMYAIAWLPVLIVLGMALSSGLGLLMSLAEQQDMLLQGEIAQEALAEHMALLGEYAKGIVLQTLLYLIPAIAITGPATAGVAYVTRNWARDEHAFVWSDFKDAAKENWKQALAVSTITGFAPIVLYVCWMFYGEMARQNAIFLIPQVLSTTLALLWLCSLLFMYPLMVTYKLRFRDLLKNGFLLTVGRLPLVVGLKLLSLVPVLIALVAAFFFTQYIQWVLLILLAYYVVFGFSLSRFVSASYSNAVFDKYINPNIAGAEVGRGLYNPEDEDEEETESSPEGEPHSAQEGQD